MARLRKEKGGTSQHAELKKQVKALGGTNEDYELVKNIKEPLPSTEGPVDPALSKDVSKFLKGLSLSGQSNDHEEPKKSAKTSKAQTQAPRKAAKLKLPPKAEAVQKDEPLPILSPDAVPTKLSFNPKSHFVAPPIAQWYTSISTLPPAAAPTPAQLASLTSRASSLLDTDTLTFITPSNSSKAANPASTSTAEAHFLSKIIQSGTLSDRLSALTLLVQSSPLHNTKALTTLKTMAERGKGKGGREESLKALRCVVDWWVGGGVPNRKLRYFRDQPLLHPNVTDQHLLVWFFEDWLKKYFFSILQILETLSLDPLPYVRTQALTLIFTLLRDKPEQEQNLLRLLVNKLGDTEKSLCSRTSYHILQLLQSHPSMKAVIVREIIALVLRPSQAASTTTSEPLMAGTGTHIRFADAEPKPKPKPKQDEKKPGTGINVHARYYATITFNQIVLTSTPGDRGVALQLIDVYFEMFKELLGEGKDGQVEDDEAVQGEEVKKDKGGRIRVREAKKGKGGKGKGKVIEVKGAAGFAEVEDAHSRLISAILTGVNRALPFAKIDAEDANLNKHIDTLFLITHTSTFNISLQALVLIQQISASLITPSSSSSASAASTTKSITDRYYRTLYASLHDPRLATSSKQAMYLNLLFKSIKADAGNVDSERVKALVRRFAQVLVSGGSGATEFVAGGLFLLGELFGSVPGLRSMLAQNPDAPVEEEKDADYDPRKRDPQFAHASSSPLWEIAPLVHHYHPAVSLHARQLLSSQPLTASADLSLNTLSHFLDRFVYKNPKKVKVNADGEAPASMAAGKGKGASAMQPAASGMDGTGVKLLRGEVEDLEGRVNEAAFLKRKAEDVPVDQLFFHKFFSRKVEKERAKAAKASKRKDREDSDDDDDDEAEEEDEGEGDKVTEIKEPEQNDDDDEEEGSDDEEAEIWKAMQASMPKAIGDDDDIMEDSDELPSDLDDDSDDDSEEVEDDDDDALSLVEGSDNEDLLSLDEDFPEGLIEYDGPDGEDDQEDEEWGGISADDGGSKKRKREETKGEKRKKLRSLPTFASYEDYAKMIEDGPEDDI